MCLLSRKAINPVWLAYFVTQVVTTVAVKPSQRTALAVTHVCLCVCLPFSETNVHAWGGLASAWCPMQARSVGVFQAHSKPRRVPTVADVQPAGAAASFGGNARGGGRAVCRHSGTRRVADGVVRHHGDPSPGAGTLSISICVI